MRLTTTAALALLLLAALVHADKEVDESTKLSSTKTKLFDFEAKQAETEAEKKSKASPKSEVDDAKTPEEEDDVSKLPKEHRTIDICPTILSLFDSKAPRDMAAKPIRSLFA